MRRSTVLLGKLCLAGLLLATLPRLDRADEPTKIAEAVKPPWQRLLQGADAKKAAEQEKKLEQLQEAGQFAEALKVAEALVEARQQVQGADHWQAVNARWRVTALRSAIMQGEEGRKEYAGSFALAREADALESKGRYKDAQPHKKKLLAICRKVLGEEHPETATSCNNVAYNLNAQSKYKEAEEGYTKALAIRRKVLGEEHPDTALSYNNVAYNLYAQGRNKEAEEGFRKALAIQRKVLGEEHTQTATSYNNLALNLSAQGKYKEAEEGYRKALAIKRKVLGEEHPHTATAYNNVAANLNDRARYKEAEEGYRKALAIFRKVLGEEHPNTALGYNNLALNLHAQGKYREAEEGMRMALAICRKVLGDEHLHTTQIYNNLAFNLNVQGKYREAEEGFRKALAICRKVLGEKHPQTAASYNNLADNLNAQAKYKEAEEGFRKALAIRRKVLGEEHPDTATSYNNVAANLNDQGKHREAEEGYGKALAIYRKVLGEEHPDTAHSYTNVAFNLHAQGKCREAEEGLRKALAIRRKALGEEHPQTAKSYSNVAFNLHDQGKYKEAEEGLRKTLAICRKVLGEEHPQTAASYNNLSANLHAQGKHKEAEKGLRKALANRRKVLGEEHPSTAQSYNNLAANLDAQGKHKEAEEGHRKALAIFRKVLGEEHPDTAMSCNNVALTLDAQGKYKEAEGSYRTALAIWSNVLGEEHPETALGYNNLGLNLNAQAKYKEAEFYFLHAAESFAKARLHIAATGLERATFASKQSPLQVLSTVLARNGKPDDAWQRFEESLARGTWDDLNARLHRPKAERDKQAQISARIERLRKLTERASVAKPTPEQTKQRDEFLSQLRQAYDDLAAFTQQLEKQYGPVAGQVLPHTQIQKSLTDDAALVAWLDIAGQPKAADPNGEHWAVLLRSSGAPVWLRLSGSGDKHAWTDADTKLPAQLREALQSPHGLWQTLAERLRKQRLDPLASHLKGVRRLLVLPSTALAGVPVEVIAHNYTVSYAHSASMYAHLRQQSPPTGKGLFALADPIFDAQTVKDKPQPLPPSGVLLTMVLPGSNADRAGLKPNDVLLRYGDTDLGKRADLKLQPESKDPDKRVTVIVWREGHKLTRPLLVSPGKLGVVIAQEPAPQALAEQRRLDHLLASRSGDEGKWSRLPGTRFEVASLHRLFDKDTAAQVLLDSDSSEQRLNELARSGVLGKYRYLHLATHGEVDNVFPLRSAVILSRDHLPDDKQRTELLLSGQPIPDGRLTAEEALQRWNLNCDLVTLSACQTALGKYERGEGYVGFAQALILCGTRSVCLSLWKVDDTATALLMERFYQNLLGKRDGLKAPLSKAAAMMEAKSWLRTLSREEAMQRAATLSEGVSRGKGAAKLPTLQMPQAAAKANSGDRPFAHPYYWAAFVLVGHAE